MKVIGDRIKILEDIYENHLGRRVGINIDTTEKQLLYDLSSTMVRVEKALNDISMTIKKVNNIKTVKPIETVKPVEVEEEKPAETQSIEVDIPDNPTIPVIPQVKDQEVVKEEMPEVQPVEESEKIPMEELKGNFSTEIANEISPEKLTKKNKSKKSKEVTLNE